MRAKLWLKSKFNVMFTVFMSLVVILSVAGVLSVWATEDLNQFSSFQDYQGLVGFTGEYALSDDDSPVRVIVLFETGPAAVQIYEAEAEGLTLSEGAAERAVEDEHTLFEQELAQLFSDTSFEAESNRSSESTSEPYEILWEYRIALNGVNMLLPSNMVEEVANFESVQTIFPDVALEIEPLPEPESFDADSIELLSDRNPAGMAPGRATMRADDLHALGYKGEGVLIAMLDTGIYYNHPAFEGAFPTIEEMQERNSELTNADGIDIDGTYYYVGRNFFMHGTENPLNDPSENHTSHGTHVAGTIVGRDAGSNPAILGVAPEAQVITYRMLSQTPNATAIQTRQGVVVAAIERSAADKVDVVNMSFGNVGVNAVTNLTSVAINNVMLANPNMVFVAAAGNSGPASFTVNSPGPGSKYIAVASIDVTYDWTAIVRERAQWAVNSGSSRGPAGLSFEIKPDLGAHGNGVFSA
ncbi:MAG: S8 family serine peptidase, partial [Coriobacteriia bacterium]|nr:S8 family serine peptidase [Coriobacteriia bacterium]